ncbi:MAG: hypothetical protein QME78_15710 [Thermodesulfobacteriota bacterium]|nr:hypothetical protein [Thermodesulfobacteriota bacterium]
MKKSSLIGTFIVLFLLTLRVGAGGQEVQNITTKGEGWFEGSDMLIGKDRAIKDALVKAVEQAVGTMVSSETRVQNFQLLNDEIYTKTEGYVQSYKIIGENQGKNVYEVTIQAAVAIGSIKDKLDALGLLLSRVGKPRIMILIAEQNIGKTHYYYWWGLHRGEQADLAITENTIMDRFREKGFDLVDHQAQSKNITVTPAFRVAELNDRAAITLGKQADAEVVIVGKALARSLGPIAGTAMKSTQANVSLRAIQTDTGSVLSSGSEHAAAVHIDEVTGGVEALKKASAKISEKMMDDIIKNFQKRVGATTLVQIIVNGLSSHEDIRKFKNMLQGQVRGVEGVYERSFSGNVAKIELDIKGSAQSLSEEISRKSFKEFAVKVVGTTWNTIEIVVTPR